MTARENGDDNCPNCDELVGASAIMHCCPECGAEGYDECCFPAGTGTVCLDCEGGVV